MYGEIVALRRALTEERRLELGDGIPFTASDWQLIEMRLQTILMYDSSAMGVSGEINAGNTTSLEARGNK